MSGGVQKRWLSVKSRIIRSYFEKKPRSRKKSKKVKKRIKLLQYDKKIICKEKITPDGMAACARSCDGRAVGAWQENRIVLPADYG